MRKTFVTVCVLMLLAVSPAGAATITLNFTWSVTNTPTVPATHYRVDELVSGAWVARTTVPASQLTYAIPGRAVGTTYTFSVMPLNNGTEGIRSESSVCGTVVSAPPTTTLTFSCTPDVVP